MSAPGALLTPESVRLENGSFAGEAGGAGGAGGSVGVDAEDWNEWGLPKGGGGGVVCVSLPGGAIGATS